MVSFTLVSSALAAAPPAVPALPEIPAAMLNIAKDPALPLTRYNRSIAGGAHTNGAWNGGWQVGLAIAAWQGNTAADARLLQQINYNLTGVNAISANGGYPTQHELFMTGSYAILKQSDRFWNQVLTETQRNKIDLVMKAAVVASAYTTADASYAGGKTITTLDGDTNLHRGWNSNYQEGMFGNLIAGEVYFGGAAPVNALLNTYNHNAFVAELQNAGLTDIAETFTWAQNHPNDGAPTGATIQANIRNYKYNGAGLADPFTQYARLSQTVTYSKTVSAGLNNGAGVLYNGTAAGLIAGGAAGLPNQGKAGMLQEFDTVDANGKRSSASYAYYDFRPNLINNAVVLIGGYWQAGPVANDILGRMDVGITDLKYKLTQGYRDYAKGVGSGTSVLTDPRYASSYGSMFPLWSDVLRPYYFADAGAPTSIDSTSAFQNFALDKAYTQALTITFDATPHANLMDGAIGLLEGQAVNWTDLAAIVRFNPDGRIDARRGSAYAADAVLPYTAETMYRIRMVVDPLSQRYSVYVTPDGGSEIRLAYHYAFRSEQAMTDLIDHWALRHVEGRFSVENVTITVPEPAALAAIAGLAGSRLLARRRPRGCLGEKNIAENG